MGERDRNQYYERNQPRYRDDSPYRDRDRDRDREGRDWDRDVDYSPWRTQSETERDDYGRNYTYRNYNERSGGRPYEQQYGGRNVDYENRRFPGTFGSYEDQRIGSERDRGRRYGYESSSSYGTNYDYRDREPHTDQNVYGRWEQRDDRGYERGYERDRDERSFGQQLREAGGRAIQKVKRAFRGPKGYKRSDERIREDVSDRLSQLDELDPTEIEVSVSNSEVTLTGSVATRREKFLAEEVSDDVSGVTEVHNQLRVRREQTQRTTGAEASSALGAQAVGDAARNRNARA